MDLQRNLQDYRSRLGLRENPLTPMLAADGFFSIRCGCATWP